MARLAEQLDENRQSPIARQFISSSNRYTPSVLLTEMTARSEHDTDSSVLQMRCCHMKIRSADARPVVAQFRDGASEKKEHFDREGLRAGRL